VFELKAGQRCTIGRSTNNRVVLKDEMCSREHAEVLYADQRWYLRDLGSLNGTRVNGKNVKDDVPLTPRDLINLGNSDLIFVENVDQLPELPRKAPARAEEKFEIRHRLSETHYLPSETPRATLTGNEEKAKIVSNFRSLYQLALKMAIADSEQVLVKDVLDALMELVQADVGAILFLGIEGELKLIDSRFRNPKVKGYQPASSYVSNEVIQSRKAALAEDIAQDRHLRIRESLTDLQATSLICTPILFRDQLLGLIHLYCIDPSHRLDNDDLDLSVAVAQHLGPALFQLRRRLTAENRGAGLSAENRSLRDQLRIETMLVGASQSLKDIESQIARVAETSATVLIRGESGTGKELVARAIHNASPRRDGPFVTLNCAALTETLLESELFGHEKGAFTGATERMIGKFEAANQGTIFLDEIGEMALGTQAKFLRVLEGHAFERVGGNTQIHVDVRVVSATNAALEEAVRSGGFRRDLFFRLQVVEISVPPLRDRREDIRILAEHFLSRFVRETGRKIKGFSDDAVRKLETYHWPGNVRELRNVIERAVALGHGPLLEVGDIWLSNLEIDTPDAAAVAYAPVSLEEIEKRQIIATLEHTNWNKSQTAQILGIERSTLDRKIKTFDLQR